MCSGVEPFESRWPDIQTMAAEIKQFFPVLLSVDPALEPTRVEAEPQVEWRLYGKDGKTYLLVVNSGDEGTVATFRFPRRFRSVDVPFGQDNARLSGKTLTVPLAALEPKMICLTP